MKLNKMIDHTMLKANATEDEIINLCKEAREYDFASVCVNGYYTSLVKRELEGSSVKVCSVVGFPLGAMSTESKALEAKNCVKDGADEIDMVINIGALKDGKDDIVRNDIKSVVESSGKAIVKVIIETCLLNEDEKRKACRLAVEAGAAFVKTSTGFSTGGAKAADIKLMREVVGDKANIKASGGVRTREDALEMIEAGADRIGASNGIALLK